MKAFCGMEIQLHTFLIMVLDGHELSASHPGCFTPWKEPPAAWVGSKPNLHGWEKKWSLAPYGNWTLIPQ